MRALKTSASIALFRCRSLSELNNLRLKTDPFHMYSVTYHLHIGVKKQKKYAPNNLLQVRLLRLVGGVSQNEPTHDFTVFITNRHNFIFMHGYCQVTLVIYV